MKAHNSNSNGSNAPLLIALAASASTVMVASMYVAYRNRYKYESKSDSTDNTCTDSRKSSPAGTGISSIPKIPTPLWHSPYRVELQLAIRLAYHAGSNMKGYILAKGTLDESTFDLGMETKSSNVDLCTKVDIENEAFITKGIQTAYPNHIIIGEETVGTGTIPELQTNTPTWIIDPIDGTTNFSQGLFMTCVSIGYCVDGKPVMGVVYAPATEEWYIAISGYGAFRNGIPIQHTSTCTKTKLQNAVVCCEFGYSRKQQEIEAMVGAVSRILQHGCRAIRQLGSGVLDLCYVATGRIHVVYAGVANEGWKPWDYAAGLVICQEAGCIMESIDHTPGEPFNLYGKSILCGGSREIVNELRSIILPVVL